LGCKFNCVKSGNIIAAWHGLIFQPLHSHSGHSFAHAAFFQIVFSKAFQLPVKQVIVLFDKTNGHIENGFGWAHFHQRHPIRGFVLLAAKFPHFFKLHRTIFPLLVSAGAKVVLIIKQQLLSAGFGYIYQLDFHFLNGNFALAPFL
jgi:hypothetical protein